MENYYSLPVPPAHAQQVFVQYSCAVVSVFGSGRKSVLVLHTYVLRAQYNCGVLLVFWSWREIVIDFTYLFSVQYSCGVVNINGKNYNRKKGTVVWPCWNTCQNTNTNYDQKKIRPEKKVQSSCLHHLQHT
jgi:hypothetical protein